MIPYIIELIPTISVKATPFNNKNAHQSDRHHFWRSGELILNFCRDSGNYYYFIGSKIDKKKYQNAVADTKLVDFKPGKMSLRHSEKNNLKIPFKDSTNQTKQSSLECKFCKSDKVVFSSGKGCHSLRADCKWCRKTWWVSKDDATALIESGSISLQQSGKQLSLFGGEADA